MIKRLFNLRSNKVLPITFPKINNIYNINHCVICFDNLNDDQISLPCGHRFHSVCILKWFEQQMCCPTCKMKIQWSIIKLNVNIKQ